jgi:hypothetical protein
MSMFLSMSVSMDTDTDRDMDVDVDTDRSCFEVLHQQWQTKCPHPCVPVHFHVHGHRHGQGYGHGHGHGQISPVKYSRIYYIVSNGFFKNNNNFQYISLLSTFLTIFDIMSSHSAFITFDIFYHLTFCPNWPFLLSTLFLFDVLSHSTFCPFNVFYHSTFCHSAFCPIRRFVL